MVKDKLISAKRIDTAGHEAARGSRREASPCKHRFSGCFI